MNPEIPTNSENELAYIRDILRQHTDKINMLDKRTGEADHTPLPKDYVSKENLHHEPHTHAIYIINKRLNAMCAQYDLSDIREMIKKALTNPHTKEHKHEH